MEASSDSASSGPRARLQKKFELQRLCSGFLPYASCRKAAQLVPRSVTAEPGEVRKFESLEVAGTTSFLSGKPWLWFWVQKQAAAAASRNCRLFFGSNKPPWPWQQQAATTSNNYHLCHASALTLNLADKQATATAAAAATSSYRFCPALVLSAYADCSSICNCGSSNNNFLALATDSFLVSSVPQPAEAAATNRNYPFFWSALALRP